ncbi:MAG: asparagine synthase (glutamine-hydrolyzing) [Candidatus Acidiferrales bacterium]
MCGICGVIGIEQQERNETIVRRMMATLRHRGPDDEGILLAPAVAVGMRRLSIIDLRGGNQPVWNETGTIAAICNGEIYNFRELRRELEAKGHSFRSQSDTEVLVHAYESWGDAFLQHLRGMFAFAILETPEGRGRAIHRVFLARDRLGIKPLYYAIANGRVVFASEVRALLASGLIPARLSSAALTSFLSFGSVGEPMTLVDGVFSLPPGHFMEIDPADRPVVAEPKPYWEMNRAREAHDSASSLDGQPPTKRLRSYLQDAVREHLIADVPLGVFLSSGLDSTAIAALASRERKGIQSFTVVFPEQDFSEAELARRSAQKLGTQHSECLLSGDDMLTRLGEAVAAFDQPSMDGINTFFVSGAARQAGLKVALSGLGSDELFGGYPTFRSVARLKHVAALVRSLPRPLRVTAGAALETLGKMLMQPDAARKLAAACSRPCAFPHTYFFSRVLFTPGKVASLLSWDSEAATTSSCWEWLEESTREAGALDSFGAVSWLELRSYMVNTLLRDTDAMSMAHSLEVRVPFLDHRLVEFVLALPASEKQCGGIPKSLLIEAVQELLPQEIIDRPKRTFTFPWEKWLRGALKGRVESGLSEWSPSLEPILARDSARKIWLDFLEKRTSWSRPWSLYILNEWTKRNLDNGAGSVVADQPAAAISAA